MQISRLRDFARPFDKTSEKATDAPHVDLMAITN